MDKATYKATYLKAHEIFIEQLTESSGRNFPYVCFEPSKKVLNFHWRLLADRLVSDHLRELANSVNAWRFQLTNLEAWSTTLGHFSENMQRELRSSNVDVIAWFCLQQPYAVRERFIHSISEVLHQANLTVITDYADTLPKDTAKGYLNFEAKIMALRTTGSVWKEYQSLDNLLMQLNDEKFRNRTRNFRNLANHGIPHHFEFGHGVSVTRRMAPTSHLVARPDGSFDLKIDESRKVVSYGFGGEPPLMLNEVIEAVDEQFEVANQLMNQLSKLVDEICSQLKKK
jgi:hypothetical protein